MIYSEIAPLKRVLLHRPLLALRYLTPDNYRDFLFDDLLWVERAEEEHRAFQACLERLGAEVLLLHELLEQSLENPLARGWVIEQRLALTSLTHQQKAYLASSWQDVSARQLSQYLLAGVLLSDYPNVERDLFSQDDLAHKFLLNPLPNQLYVRDTSVWIGDGVSVLPMHFSIRQGESLNLAVIYQFHPLFQAQPPKFWFPIDALADSPGFAGLGSLEGGDILVISPRCLLIGLSERSQASAIERLALALFAANAVDEILVLSLPRSRRFMHLDVLMTMVNESSFVLAEPMAIWSNACPNTWPKAWRLLPSKHPQQVVIEAQNDFSASLAKVLGVKSIDWLIPAGDHFQLQREQWFDAANLLTVAPGEVISYDRNEAMNQHLRQHGLSVHEIPSAELSRGRGGPRCMSCPWQRGGQ
jgi:arginine deiminase